jgi:hypothetical protein
MRIGHLPLICLALIAATSRGSAQLTTATTDDKTASVGIPNGWKLAKGLNGFVYVTGPNDQRVNLGVIVIGKNGPAGAGTSGLVAGTERS